MADGGGNIISVQAGRDAQFSIEPADSAGAPIPYLGDEILAVQVWQGDDLAPELGVAAAEWAGEGTEGSPRLILVSINRTATATMPETWHRITISVQRGGLVMEAWTGWLHVEDAPGQAQPPPTSTARSRTCSTPAATGSSG